MKLTNDVLAVLSALDVVGDKVRIVEQLERSHYERTNKVLEALGGKWNRKEKAHVFPFLNVSERIDATIIAGEVSTARDTGFFPTPVLLARDLVELAGVQKGHLVLEPSAGTGRIVDAILAKGASVIAVERDEAMRKALILNAATTSAWSFGVREIDDFMLYMSGTFGLAPIDRVVMNPPFARVGLGDHLDHVMLAEAILAPGGCLVSVLPSGVVFRRDRRHTQFRAFVEKHGGEMTPLPEGSFRESGTNVSTVVLRMTKS